MKQNDLQTTVPQPASDVHSALVEILRLHREQGNPITYKLLQPLLYMPATASGEEVAALALSIADEAARSDIEAFCTWSSKEPANRWYDTATIDDQEFAGELRATVDRAVRYLDLRGLLVRSGVRPNFVQFK